MSTYNKSLTVFFFIAAVGHDDFFMNHSPNNVALVWTFPGGFDEKICHTSQNFGGRKICKTGSKSD